MKKNKRKKIWWIAGGLVILALLASLLMKEESLEAETARALKGKITEYIIEEGKSSMLRDYTVSMPLNGRIRPVTLQEGDYVVKGSAIAYVDVFAKTQEISSLNSKLKELDAMLKSVDVSKPKTEDIKTAKLKVEEASLNLEQLEKQKQIAFITYNQDKTTYERNRVLYEQDVVNKSVFDEIKTRLDISEKQLQNLGLQQNAARKAMEAAELNYSRLVNSVQDNEYQREMYQAQKEQVKTQLNILGDELGRGSIRAPFNGPVTEIYINDETVLPAGTKILKIGDLSSTVIEADILSEEINQVKAGQLVEISGKALNDRVASGRVERIYPAGFTKISALGVEQQRVKVIVNFDNNVYKIRPATSVDLKIITAARDNTVIIPERALFRDKGEWFVFRLDGESKAELTQVKIGLRNDETAEILEGLKEGELVISETSNSIKPGIKIVSRDQ